MKIYENFYCQNLFIISFLFQIFGGFFQFFNLITFFYIFDFSAFKFAFSGLVNIYFL